MCATRGPHEICAAMQSSRPIIEEQLYPTLSTNASASDSLNLGQRSALEDAPTLEIILTRELPISPRNGGSLLQASPLTKPALPALPALPGRALRRP